MTQIQQQKAARDFAQRWKGKGYEKGDSQIFWSTLLTEVFGVEHVDTFLLYEQRARIEATAQAILDARALYPDSSLADLYDEVAMPPELRRAHQENDRAVMAAYGFSTKMTESECVAKLFELYQKLSK